MIGTLINLIIVLIVVGVIWWAVEQLLPLVPLPAPFAQVVRVLLIVVLVLVVVFYVVVPLIGMIPGAGHLR